MAKKRNMTRQGGPVFYHAWANWNEGEMVGGVIVGTSVDKKYKRKNYHVKVETFDIEATNQNDEPMKEGDTLVLNGCGILEKHLANSAKGDYIEVTYEGEAEITGGEWEGEIAHSIAVALEDGDLPNAGDVDDSGDLL